MAMTGWVSFGNVPLVLNCICYAMIYRNIEAAYTSLAGDIESITYLRMQGIDLGSIGPAAAAGRVR